MITTATTVSWVFSQTTVCVCACFSICINLQCVLPVHFLYEHIFATHPVTAFHGWCCEPRRDSYTFSTPWLTVAFLQLCRSVWVCVCVCLCACDRWQWYTHTHTHSSADRWTQINSVMPQENNIVVVVVVVVVVAAAGGGIFAAVGGHQNNLAKEQKNTGCGKPSPLPPPPPPPQCFSHPVIKCSET